MPEHPERSLPLPNGEKRQARTYYIEVSPGLVGIAVVGIAERPLSASYTEDHLRKADAHRQRTEPVMRTVNGVYEQMLTKQYCKEVIETAAKGKSDNFYVGKVLKDIDHYADCLLDMLATESYVPSLPKVDVMQCGDKVRRIKKVKFFPDRCVEHAIARVMLPKWDSVIGEDTFASWKNRGINTGRQGYSINRRLKQYISSYSMDEPLYAFKWDIRKCYESVDNDVLDAINARYCRDKRMLNLMSLINHSDPEGGLDIGRYLSQLWIQLYLTPLDRFVKQRLHSRHYVRYMDDGCNLNTEKDILHEWEQRLRQFLWYELHMELNGKRQIFPVGRNRRERSIDMCGYCFFRNFTLLRKRIKVNMKQKLDQPQSMSSYKGLLMNCESANLVVSLGYDNIHRVGREENRQAV